MKKLIGIVALAAMLAQGASRTEMIQACSDESNNCYSVAADLDYSYGKVYVARIYFENGGYLDFSGVTLPGSGLDDQQRLWSFSR